jgi:hypothetical protein
MLAVGPELDRVRTHAKSGPTRGSRDFPAPELPREPREPQEKVSTRTKPSTLMRGARGKLALPRPVRPVGLGLRGRDLLSASLHADLPALRLPVERKRRARIVAQFIPLVASGIGEEHETSLVDPLEQDEPDGYLAAACRRCKCHRLIVRNSQAPRIIEPADELRNRVVAAPRHTRNHPIRASSTAINRYQEFESQHWHQRWRLSSWTLRAHSLHHWLFQLIFGEAGLGNGASLGSRELTL